MVLGCSVKDVLVVVYMICHVGLSFILQACGICMSYVYCNVANLMGGHRTIVKVVLTRQIMQ